MEPWFNFLRIESDLAMTFIDSARLRRSPGESAISIGNARKALAEIRRGLKRPSRRRYFTENEVFFLEQRCAQIEAALSAIVATHNLGDHPRFAVEVAEVIRLAAQCGIVASAVIGNAHLFQFSTGGLLTTIHTSPDFQTFGPHAVLRLVQFFPGRLSVQTFWPEPD